MLIVDDHAGFREVARRLLDDGGFRVVGESSTGSGALDAALDLKPDVVLLDVQLPDIDGFEVAARLGQVGCSSAIVLTSTRAASDYRGRLARGGVRGFIPKSALSPRSLRDVLGDG